MFWKAIKLGAAATTGAAVLGGAVLGSDLCSYAGSSFRSVSRAVKDNVPVEFQIRRARDLLEATEPEMQKNIRLIAEEEVDIATLKTDIGEANRSLVSEKTHLQGLRETLATTQPSFIMGDLSYTRGQLTQELARQFERYKSADNAMEQKRKLLDSREAALAAANRAMQIAGDQRVALQAEVDGLESHYRLIQATAVGTNVQVDNSRLAQAEKVVGDVRRQLAISEQTLAEQAKFTHAIPVDAPSEKDLLQEVDACITGTPAVAVNTK